MENECRLRYPFAVAVLAGIAVIAAPAAARQQPTVVKEILDCPEPCSQAIRSTPSVTTVTYTITVHNPNTDPAPLYLDIYDDIPAGALAYRVIDKGVFQGCQGSSGPTCANLPAPEGANGTGQVVILNLGLSPAGRLFETATIVVEVDFACPPLSAFDVVSNQAKVLTPNEATLCGSGCLSNTVAFTASCLPAPEYTFTKTVDKTEWSPGQSTVLNYTMVITNTSATRTIIGQFIEIADFLPFHCSPLGCNPWFDRDKTCDIPVKVTPPPASPMIIDNQQCKDGQPELHILRFPDLGPGQSIKLEFPITLLDQLQDNLDVCNKAELILSGVTGANASACTLIHQPEPNNFNESHKDVAPDAVFKGDPITYTLYVTNSGSAPATNVVVTDDLPVCLDYSSFLPGRDVTYQPGPGSATITGGKLTINLGTMPPNMTQKVTINGIRAGDLFLSCCNLAYVTTDLIKAPGNTIGRSPGGTNVPRCFDVIIPPPPGFKGSTKSALPSSVELNGPVRYTLDVQNTGAGTAHNVIVRDSFASCLDDTGFDPLVDVSVAGGPFTATYNARTLTVKLETMSAGDVRTVTVNGLRGKVETASCCNQAYITADELASPGDVTESTPGAGDPTCVPITPAAPRGCDLLRRVVTGKAPDPWVYTNVCAADDVRLPLPPFRTDIPNDDDVEPLGGSPGDLTLYQLDCRCSNVISIIKNHLVSPPVVRLRD